MPLPSDEKLIALADELLQQFETLFGAHPGFRPAHAKGALLTGTFTPAKEAAMLSKAPHFARESTPVTVRFSNSTGVPVIPDNDPNANPKGIAIRFHLAERVHTDIIAHSTDGFPTHTGAEFLEFLKAIAATTPEAPHPNPVEQFVGSHPAALAFVQAPKPFPVSFATEAYFGVTALEFVSAEGVSQFFRYHIVPEAGLGYLGDEAAKARVPDYLFEEIKQRVAAGPVRFTVKAQLAAPGDVVDDATIHWPADRAVAELGTLELTAVVANDAEEQRTTIFDPIPRVEGIEPSNDPLLELRAAIYLISGRRRRAAAPQA
jgi:catalase